MREELSEVRDFEHKDFGGKKFEKWENREREREREINPNSVHNRTPFLLI